MAQPTSHDPQAEGRLARQRFAAAFMSDTKWRKLFEVVQAARPDLARMFVKFVDTPVARSMRFPPDLHCPRAYMDTIEFGPTALRAIEWLELEADLSATLASVGHFLIKVDEGRTRVIGYGDPVEANGS